MAVVSATTTGGTSATSVGLSLLGTSLKLPPVSSVLVPEQSINDVLTTLLPANPTTGSSVVPGVDVSSTAPPGLSEVVPGVDVSSTAPPGLSEVVPGVDVSPAVPPDLSEVVPGDFDVSVEPHEGEAATTSTGEERTADEEDTPVCKLCVCLIGFFCCCCCFFFFFFYTCGSGFQLVGFCFHFLSLLCCRFESVSIPEDECKIHGVVSEIEKDNTGRRR